MSIQCTSEESSSKTRCLAELEGATEARWKAQFTFNFAFTDLSAIPLTKRGVTSWSEKMLFSAHSTLKKNQTTACSKLVSDKVFNHGCLSSEQLLSPALAVLRS